MWCVLISLRVGLWCCGFGDCVLLFCFSSFVLDYCFGLVGVGGVYCCDLLRWLVYLVGLLIVL